MTSGMNFTIMASCGSSQLEKDIISMINQLKILIFDFKFLCFQSVKQYPKFEEYFFDPKKTQKMQKTQKTQKTQKYFHKNSSFNNCSVKPFISFLTFYCSNFKP
jgi:hypothetical protein